MEKKPVAADMKPIPIKKGELGIVNNATIRLIMDSSKTNLAFEKDSNENVIMKLSITLKMIKSNDIVIGGDHTTVDATSVGVFNFADPNCFSQGAFNNLILTTGAAPGEVKFTSIGEDIELTTDGEKREHGDALTVRKKN